ncbi:helix-turn-helix domain-containing protein [Oceanimonas sp. AH20CE76]|uniref:helix-turn-helix domain-containing protein n=1 Tax=Oceanimonas sp. AH20CE76 TaxID=2977120 RepID=UPI0031FF3A8F
MDISERTLKRWQAADGQVTADKRPEAERVAQPHKLTQAEELAILNVCNQPQYRSLPPSQIVPSLADKGIYLASESSFYRVLKKHQQQHHRGRTKPRHKGMAATQSYAQDGHYDFSCFVLILLGKSKGKERPCHTRHRTLNKSKQQGLVFRCAPNEP